MTIDAFILNKLIPTHAPSCILPQPYVRTVEENIIDDFTGFLRSFLYAEGNNGDPSMKYIMTGDQLVNLFAKHVTKQANGTKSVITLMDLKKYVPVEKAEEWEKRAKSRKNVEPYKRGFLLLSEGIIETPSTSLTPVPLNIERLTRSGDDGRRALYELIRASCPISRWNRPFVLDMDDQGPCIWKPGSLWTVESRWKSCRESSPKIRLGEVDVRMFYYVRLLGPGARIVVVSKDGDQVPITLCYLLKTDRSQWPSSFIWERPGSGKNAKTVYYDMLLMFDELAKFRGLTYHGYNPITSHEVIFFWIYVCILCKTDFFPKALLSTDFGAMKVFDTLRVGWSEIYPSASIRNYEDMLTEFVFHQFWLLFSTASPERCLRGRGMNEELSRYEMFTSLEQISTAHALKGWIQWPVPTQGNIEQATVRMDMNVEYWTEEFYLPPLPPTDASFYTVLDLPTLLLLPVPVPVPTGSKRKATSSSSPPPSPQKKQKKQKNQPIPRPRPRPRSRVPVVVVDEEEIQDMMMSLDAPMITIPSKKGSKTRKTRKTRKTKKKIEEIIEITTEEEEVEEEEEEDEITRGVREWMKEARELAFKSDQMFQEAKKVLASLMR